MKIYSTPHKIAGLDHVNADGEETFGFLELAKVGDPAKPPEGCSIIWESDGNGFGEAGDVIMASTVNGVTKRKVIFADADGSTW